MTWLEWIYLTALLVGAVMYLGDAINSCTAAVRELLETMRKEKPWLP